MLKKVLLLVLIVLLLLPAALAQDDDNPTIAILRLGPFSSYVIAEDGILDVLESYGYVSSEENMLLKERQDMQGENLNVIWGDAAWDLASANLLVENALDQDVDVMVVIGTAITQTAVKATLDMEDPPVVLFTAAYNPYEAGIAQASCIKPAHVSGSESLTDYSHVFSTLLLQDPDMGSIGIIHSASEISGVIGAETITALAEELGWTAEVAAVASLTDLRPAAEGLLSKGVQAFVLPADELTSNGLPIVVTVANENGVPVFHSTAVGIFSGATVGSGFFRYYQQGTDVGVLLTGYLNGDIDIASTAINISSTQAIGVNVTTAEEQGVELSEALLDQAMLAVRGDGTVVSASEDMLKLLANSLGVNTLPMDDSGEVDSEFLTAIMTVYLTGSVNIASGEEQEMEGDGAADSVPPDLLTLVVERLQSATPLEFRAEADQAFLAALQCTDEMIAEQQAELDASE